MNTKKFLLSVFTGFVSSTVASFLLEQLISQNYMERAFYQPTGIPEVSATQLPILALAVPLSIGLIMAYAYLKGLFAKSLYYKRSWVVCFVRRCRTKHTTQSCLFSLGI